MDGAATDVSGEGCSRSNNSNCYLELRNGETTVKKPTDRLLPS